MFAPLYENSKGHWNRYAILTLATKSELTVYSTIHGMVYNAMKLFMEVNPQLFDECSHEYTEHQNNADQRLQARQAKWDRLSELAQKMKAGFPPAAAASVTGGAASGTSVTSPLRTDDTDPLRLEQLRLQDDATAPVQDRTRGQQQASSVR